MFEKLDSNGQEKDFIKYSKIKGKYLYLQFYDIFLQGQDKVNYSDIKTCIQYDKNLRDILYVYLATFEEYLIAQILDKYELTSEFNYDKDAEDNYVEQLAKHIEIAQENREESKLYWNLKIGLGKLIKLVEKLKMPIYDSKYNDLDEIRKLRNNVMHHRVLVLGEAKTYEEFILNRDDLSNKINILAKYLPEEYSNNFINDIKKLKCDREDYKVRVWVE